MTKKGKKGKKALKAKAAKAKAMGKAAKKPIVAKPANETTAIDATKQANAINAINEFNATKTTNKNKVLDFIECLPIEVSTQILQQFYVPELRIMGTVCMKWFSMCQKLYWQKVAIIPSHDMDRFVLDPLLYDYSDSVLLDNQLFLDRTVNAISYEELHELASAPEFQEAVAKHTTELWVYYRYTNQGETVPGENARAFDTISRLFTQVSKVRISYNLGIRDAACVAFQKMVNKWKPTAEFYLGVNAHHVIGNEGYLDIQGMNIKELYVSRLTKDDEYDSDGEDEEIPRMWVSGTENGRFGVHNVKRRVPADDRIVQSRTYLPLPVSRTRGVTPMEWKSVASICKNLTRLSLLVECDAFQTFVVPDTVRHLHVTSSGTISGRPTLTVPQSVESLTVADFYDMITKGGRSILTWLNLKQATQVRKFSYSAPEFTDELEAAVLALTGSLESLALTYHGGRPIGTQRAKPLALYGLGVKELRVRVAFFGRKHGDYESYLGRYPELERLVLDLVAFGNSSPDDRKFLRKLLNRFLQGCPKVSCVQLRALRELTTVRDWMSWVSPDPFGTCVAHELDFSKFNRSI